MKKWPDRPKGLTERGYRKYMAKQKKVVVNGSSERVSKMVFRPERPLWDDRRKEEDRGLHR